jgi:tyrosyl-tRNA synthetase
MSIDTNPKKIDEILNRGVEEAIDKEEIRKKLSSGKQLRIKLGIDPTSPNLHIGRTVPLLKLRDFQKLGHKIVFIIGDFTGTIGDTSDKDSERPMLSEKQVKENMKNYIKQVGKIIDIKKCEIKHNSKWLKKLRYAEIGYQANEFSLNEFISRKNIKKRLDEGKRVSLRELLYPLMQGYDSVEIKADIEIGGTDQRFNLLAGREIQRKYGQEPQDIMTNPMIEGLDGRKMSSSWGNTINIFDSATNMYGKIMSLKDNLIIRYFALTTRVPMEEIEKYEKEIASGNNPMEYKKKLAFEITKFYHSEKEALSAQEYFIKTFSKKETPKNIKEIYPTKYDIITCLVESGLSESRSKARQAIEQNGVKINEIAISDSNAILKKGDIVQKGKRFFAKII